MSKKTTIVHNNANGTSNTTKTTITKKPKRKKPIVASNKQALQWRVPECAMHYLLALVNPFDCPAGACLPAELFPLPSGKNKTFIRSKFNLGTSGVGFVAAKPVMSNDFGAITATTSTTVLSQSALFSTATNTTTIFNIQNPFPVSDFTTTKAVAGRVVGMGLRVKYIGQLMSRNGVIAALEHPDHGDLPSAYSFDTLSSHPYSDLRRVGDGEWDSEVCLSGPTAPAEFEFVHTSAPFGDTQFPLLIAISGQPGDLYELEMVIHYETIGTKIVNKSASHSDPQVTGKILEVTKKAASNAPLKPSDGPGIFQGLVETMRESLPTLVGGIASRILPGSGPIASMLIRGLPGVGREEGSGSINRSIDGPRLLTNHSHW